MEIGDEVSDADREAATLGIKAMHDYADSLGTVSEIDGEISFYVYQNLDELSRAFARVTGMSEEDAKDEWGGGVWLGIHGYFHFTDKRGIGQVFLYTLGDYYANRDLEERIEIFAEYLYEAYHGKIRERSESCHLEYAPRWLWDGARKFAIERALVADATSYDNERERIARSARSLDRSLREMETWRKDFLSHSAPVMAAELLASRAGESSLMRYYALFPQKGAFESSFGMTLNEFYELFDAHKDAGFPKLDIPKTAPIPAPPTAPEPGSAAVALPYIAWEMGEGVLREDKFYAVCGTRIMHDYAMSLGMSDMKSTFTASAEYRYGSRSLSSVFGFGGYGIDITLYGLPHARIYSTIGAWAHELVHVFQYQLSEKSSLPPTWLIEGAAEFLADRAMLNNGALHSAERRWVVERAKRIDKPLRELKTRHNFREDDLGLKYYPYAHMAAELLASRAGEGAILRYYALLTRGTDWRDAFESAFGLTVDDFYVLFEAHRAAGFPPLEIPASAP